MGWCLLIIAAPILAGHDFTTSSGLIYLAFSHLCHQHSDRSFFIADKQFAVCSRCTGIYCGFLLGILLFPITRKWGLVIPPRRRILFLASIPIAIDLFLTMAHIWKNTFYTRFFSGILFGSILSLFIIPGLFHLLSNKNKLSNLRRKI